ncbi:MG2 domain-containing protein [Chryseobacterium sp. Leaf394]|uniref:alpha-2-macroglobulin family protein n=1 Tax=Chryseobacterium sp. Leaf394 TaxID=1736361 RepID=UPI0006F24BC9|nr:MG2 domain-containing protein [Chryseobacterium sp. Leaf394]KQS93000.1 hypothetical protein ASG21_11360 [Chryseobacterium sp. Leaf394]
MTLFIKIISVLLLSIYTLGFSQIPVKRRPLKVKPIPTVNGDYRPEKPKYSKPLSPRDSIQDEIRDVVYLGYYEWDDEDENLKIDPEEDLILVLRNKIAETKGLRNTLFRFYLANIYDSYINEYGYRITKTDITFLEKLPEDYKTWALGDFYKEIDKLYNEALADRKNLQNEKTELWKLLIEDTEYAQYKPTLYDFVATSYLQFLQKQPFSVGNENEIKSGEIQKELTDFHKNDSDKTALLYLKSTVIKGNSKEQAEAYENLADAYLNEPFSAYLLQQAANLARQDNSEKNLMNAHRLCTKAIDKIPASDWQNHCKALINELENKSISIEVPERSLPGEYIPMKTIHTNTSELKIGISKQSGKIDFRKVMNWDEYRENDQLISHANRNFNDKSFRNDVFNLKKFDDYKTHQTTLAVPPLEEGVYRISVYSENNTRQNTFDITISDLFYLKRFEDNAKVDLQVINSKTGKSIAGSEYIMYQNIDDFENKYNDKRDNNVIKTGSGITSKDGIFSLPKSKDREYNNSIIYFPSLNKYVLIENDFDEIRDDIREEDQREDMLKSFIVYTDRAIYRPGQKVLFKGILKQEYYEKTKVLPKQKVLVKLFNRNQVEILKTELVTNEFGSVSGEFMLPSGGLTGGYAISMEINSNEEANGKNYYKAHTAKSFLVEEYKRPKFKVVLNPIKETYKLGDSVKVSGKADAFSGASISGATVKYQVKRQRIYLWRNYYGDYDSNYENDTETAHGETTTDSDGNFNIAFSADADSKAMGNKRSYQYIVSVDVTDINGESQNNKSTVTVGDLKAKIELSTSERMLQKEWKSVKVAVNNLNNQKLIAKGNLTVTKLLGCNKILLPKFVQNNYRRRNYDDNNSRILHYQNYDREIFDAYFPYINYDLPDYSGKLKKGETVFSKNFDTQNSESAEIDENPSPGRYLIEAQSIVENDTVSTFKIVEVLDNETFRNGNPVFLGINVDKAFYKVGEKAAVTVFSDFDEGFVNYRFIRNNKKENYQQIAMKNGKAEITFDVTDVDLKNKTYLEYDFIHDSDYISNKITFDVKENINRELDITTQVFRDKMQPGNEEKWILTIKGKDKDKINAEVLAAMYDASLDQFAKNEYEFTPHLPQNDNYRYNYNYDYYRYSTDDFLKSLTATVSSDKRYGNRKYEIPSGTEYFPVPKVPAFEYTSIRRRRQYSYSSASMISADSSKNMEIMEVVVTGFASKKEAKASSLYVIDGKISEKNIAEDEIAETTFLNPTEAVALYGQQAANGIYVITSKKAMKEELLKNVKARTNLSETAFFFPNLYTDSDGNIKLEFKSPEALTQWKLLLFAHTKDLKTGSAEFLSKTQKELMVTPNPPRFLRQGDEILISAKIDNLTEKKVSGNAMLYLFDPETNKSLDAEFLNKENLTKIKIDAKLATEVLWKIKIPYNINSVSYKIVASAGKFSDGEESVLPVLSDRMLVTETVPVFIKEGQSKTYEMKGITNPNSTSAANFNLSVELTSNPLWFAVMSVPYLRTFPHECSEQLFSRLYGNMLSAYIMNSSPKIKKVFDEWNDKETANNPLEANEELKNILVAETPWLQDIKDKEKQMQELSLFFNLNKMKKDLKKAQHDLVKRQNPDGSFSWFPGGSNDKTISGHILGGFGKLNKMLKDKSEEYFSNEIERVITNTINYLDKDYSKRLSEDRKANIKPDLADYSSYFYYRSFWTHKKEIPTELKEVLKDLSKNYIDNFKDYDLYHQAMITTFLQRYGYREQAKNLVLKLKKTAKNSEENGMYWENNSVGWYWYQAPVETQSMLIEAFSEAVPEDEKSVEEMKIWLLKNKQPESWGTTKSTTEAVYALLNFGKSWLDSEKGITMKLGTENIYPETQNEKISKAGFFKKSYFWKDITSDKGKLEITKTSPGVAWGGMHRLFYENIDNIKSSNSADVSVEKKLFVKIFDGNQPKLREITSENKLKVGDLVTVRMIIKTTKDMQYIHLKDMRGSGFEPVNVLSSYKWQNGAGYYESTKDTATNFFFSYLPKGTYVFEYELKANNAGDFSNGITTFQNMYAPAMSAHSEGMRVKIER